MEYIRYEYNIRDEKHNTYYVGSFTLKAQADKKVVDLLKAHEVERFIY